MNNNNSPLNQPPEPPMLLRMLHPTSSRQGFNPVSNQTGAASQASVDPRLAMMINMQTQQAIATYGMPTGFPYQGFSIYTPSPYGYSMQSPQPSGFFPRQQ